MRTTPEQRKMVQHVTQQILLEIFGCSFKWQKGEKAKVLTVFTMIAELHGERDPEMFNHVLDLYINYFVDETTKWAEWKDADRHNLFGYLAKKERIAIYVKKAEASKPKIAGVKTADEWDL